MQDRTIDNALLALLRVEGEQAELARRLLALRGVPLPHFMQDRPLSRGKCSRMVLAALQDGPKACGEVGERIRAQVPGITARRANNRAYQALLRLEAKGLVRREGRVWLVEQTTTPVEPHRNLP